MTPSPPENEKRRWKNYKIGVLEGRLYASEERKEALEKFFFSVGNVRINGLGVQDWASRNNGGVPLDAGEGRGDRVGRYKEDSEDGGRGVQHDRVRLAFCDINC